MFCDQASGYHASTVQTENLEEKGTAELLKILSTQITELVHQEAELARAELSKKTKKFGLGAGIFGMAGGLGLLGAGALVAAAIAGIATVLSVWAASLIVGGALLAGAGMAALTGLTEIAQGTPPLPEEAIESTKEDLTWLKTQARSARP
jgi:hypothetical protein